MAPFEGEEISRAIVVYTGYGQRAWPHRDENRLTDSFGSERAVDLVKVVQALEEEFYNSDAHLAVGNLSEMGDVAAERFRSLHPEISDKAAQALAWCYTFDYK